MTLRAQPYHPVLAIFPMSLLASSLALDAMALVAHAKYFPAARFALGLGALCGIVVAVPGILDTLAYPAGARGLPVRHGVLNGVGIALMGVGWWLRRSAPGSTPTAAAVALSLAAAIVTVIAWRLAVRLTPLPRSAGA